MNSEHWTTYNEKSSAPKIKLSLLQKLRQVLCLHKFGPRPYFESIYYADIVYYQCEKCKWIGFK